MDLTCSTCGQGVNASDGAIDSDDSVWSNPVDVEHLPVFDEGLADQFAGRLGVSHGTLVAIYVLLGVIGLLAVLIAIVLGMRLFGSPASTPAAVPVAEPAVVPAKPPKTVAPDAKKLIDRLCNSAEEQQRREAARKILDLDSKAVIAALDAAARVDRNYVDVCKPAVAALAAEGFDSLDVLGAALASDRVDVRVAAAEVLRKMGPEAARAVQRLAAALDDQNRWVRWYSAEALGNLGTHAEPAVGALVALVEHPDRYTRRRVIAALGKIGPAAKAAVPALTAVKQADGDESVKQAATWSIIQIDLDKIVDDATGKAGDDVRELIEKLLGSDEDESLSAAASLTERGPKAWAAVPALGKALIAGRPQLRAAAATALGAMEVEAADYLPALREAAAGADLDVAAAAEKAIKKIETARLRESDGS